MEHTAHMTPPTMDHRMAFQPILEQVYVHYARRLHRENMERVTQELHGSIDPYDMLRCEYCDDPIRGYLEWNAYYYGNNYYYCSCYCMIESHTDMRKRPRATR